VNMKRIACALGAVAALIVVDLSFSPARAQDNLGDDRVRQDEATHGRVSGPGRERPSRGRQRQQQQQPAQPDPAVVLAEAQAILTAAGSPCQATEAKLLGKTAEQVSLYETICASGPGYIVVGSTPPETLDCLVLASQAEKKRAADPAADVGTVCTLPANQNTLTFFAAYAQEAGIACQVDQGTVAGVKSDGKLVYEIGCAGADGYWLERADAGWQKTECMQVLMQNAACPFTTPAEQAATVKSWLAGSDAAGCDVQQVRLMGHNANGRFYEATCAGAEGVIARVNAEHAVQQIYPCAEAALIGGGCKLTTTPPAATPEA